jgi:hypothetical protein
MNISLVAALSSAALLAAPMALADSPRSDAKRESPSPRRGEPSKSQSNPTPPPPIAGPYHTPPSTPVGPHGGGTAPINPKR